MKLTVEQKKKLTLIGSFASLSTIIILLLLAIFVGFNHTFGWFSANKEVTGSGMSIVVSGENYRLAIDRTGAENQISEFETSDTDNVINYLINNMGASLTRLTNPAQPKLICKLVHENQDPNETNKGIRPNSYGYISFYIDPLGNDDMVFDISIDLSAIPLSNDISVSDSTLDLLRGHVLFYQNRTPISGSTAPYYYSDRIIDSFTFDLSEHQDAACKKVIDGVTYYLVTIYWVWPNTFSQIVFEPGYERIDSYHTAISNDISANGEIAQMKEYVKSNPEEFFIFGEEYDSNTIESMLEQAQDFKNEHFAAFNIAYNEGDQQIGISISYLVVECSVLEHSDIQTPEETTAPEETTEELETTAPEETVEP